MISTSEIRVSCIIDEKYGELAVRVLHNTFNIIAGKEKAELNNGAQTA